MRCYRMLMIMLLGWLAPAVVLARQEREITFTVLYDNTVFDDGLHADWGFACLITGKEKSILFDTGTKPDVFWSNYEKLDLEPWIADVVVLSHNHRDHTGSLWSFLEKHHHVSVYAHGSFPDEFFERVKTTGAEAVRVGAPIEICEGVHLTGPLGDRVVEQSLIVETPKGLVIVVGCSHPGIVEIVKKAKDMLRQDVHLVFGGFHLLRDSREDVRKVIRGLKDLGVQRVGATHCTGEDATRMFREAYGDGFVQMGAGRVMRIKQPMPEMRGRYLGQAPPAATPKVFAPGIVSTSNLEHSAPAFSPDGHEAFWSVWKRPNVGEPQVILWMKQIEDGTWSEPQVAPFSGKWIDGGPAFSADGRRLYFYSKRPVDSATQPDANRIWYVERTSSASGWSEPKRPGLPDEARASQWSVSVTTDGTLYYNNPEGGIERSRRLEGRYTPPERLAAPINTKHLDWTVFASPDESYLIFASNRPGGRGQCDLYICFREDNGAWSEPHPMPEAINSEFQERFPLVSPDGEYLFFTRWSPKHDQDVYWVKADVIKKMREEWAAGQSGGRR